MSRHGPYRIEVPHWQSESGADFLFKTQEQALISDPYRLIWKPTRSPQWIATPALPTWGVHSSNRGRGMERVLTSGERRTKVAAAVPTGAPQAHHPGAAHHQQAQAQAPPPGGPHHPPHGAVDWDQKKRLQAVANAVFAH